LGSEDLGSGRYRALVGQEFDLLIIGGGIIGCGIARDAALRGLRVALFEKEDFGYGTSSRSTRLIHGGLRYLERYDFGLVQQDLREREILLRIAPHRVRPLPFLVPLYRRSAFYRAKLRVGMWLYDVLSYGKSLPNHRFLSREETLQAEPGLAPDGLQGAALYYDAQASFAERLCIDNVVDAAAHGAQVYNHTEVTGLLRGEKGWVTGLRVRDRLTGEEAEARGAVVINAAGPWVDALEQKLAGSSRPRLRLTKGIHFAAPPAVRHALVLFSETDARLFFVIPWMGYAWVGTTDTDFNGDLDAVRTTGEEVCYLLETVGKVLPRADWRSIYFTTAGVRALVREDRPSARESDVSRKHRLVVHTEAEGLAGMISVLGGKLTAYRSIADEVVTRAYRLPTEQYLAKNPGVRLRLRPLRPCTTQKRPLPGGDFKDLETLREEARQHAAALGLDADQADHLVFLYGTRYTHILDLIRQRPELGRRFAPAYSDVRAEVHHAVAQEFARTARDFLMRRAPLFFTPDQGQQAALPVVEEMADLFGWDESRCQAELSAYQAQVARAQAFRQEMRKS